MVEFHREKREEAENKELAVACIAAPAIIKCRESLKILRLKKRAFLPTRSTSESVGYDLMASLACVVPAKGKEVVHTDIYISVPVGTYARIAPRSGLAAKKMIDVGAGVVDPDYRGEIMVVLFNHGDEDFQVAVGDKIAQLVLEKVCVVECVEAKELKTTQRDGRSFC